MELDNIHFMCDRKSEIIYSWVDLWAIECRVSVKRVLRSTGVV